MGLTDFHFLAYWRMPGTAEEIYDIMSDITEFPRWWPASYRRVDLLEPGDAQGLGKVFVLHAKGWLPYILHIQFHVTQADRPRIISVEGHGDLEGYASWTFAPDGDTVNITYDWRLHTAQPLLTLFAPLLKPLFKSNHIWTTARGEESLRLELARRHAQTPEERAAVPDPPGPTTTSPLPVALGALVIIGGSVVCARALLGLFQRGKAV